MGADSAFFGCSERWFAKRFARELTGFLNGRHARRERAANDALDAVQLETRYDAWSSQSGSEETPGLPDGGGSDASMSASAPGGMGLAAREAVPPGRVWR